MLSASDIRTFKKVLKTLFDYTGDDGFGIGVDTDTMYTVSDALNAYIKSEQKRGAEGTASSSTRRKATPKKTKKATPKKATPKKTKRATPKKTTPKKKKKATPKKTTTPKKATTPKKTRKAAA